MRCSPSHPSCVLLSILRCCPQCADRCIRWVTHKNMAQPWAVWAHEKLLPCLQGFKTEFDRIVKVQAKIKRTQKVAGQYRSAPASGWLRTCLVACGLSC